MRGMKWLLVMMFALVPGGCSSSSPSSPPPPPTKSFSVEVHNQSDRPVTLWLTKDGPPAEEGWLTPERVAAEGGKLRYDLAFVPAGKTGFTEKFTGVFPNGTNAVLRVYEGEKEVFDLANATAHVDAVLKPGKNRFSVIESGGSLALRPGK
jgi:hypothetical protein